MEAVRAYSIAVLYQTIHTLEDSFDYEGMLTAGVRHAAVSSLALDQSMRALAPRDISAFIRGRVQGIAMCVPSARPGLAAIPTVPCPAWNATVWMYIKPRNRQGYDT